MDNDTSAYTIEQSGSTFNQPLLLQNGPILVENLIEGVSAQIGTSQLGNYTFNFEHLGTNVFRLMDIQGASPSSQGLEVIRIEPRGERMAVRTKRIDHCHPTLDTAARQQGSRHEIVLPQFGTAPVPLVRMFLPTAGSSAGKISLFVVLSNGTSWFEEHAFRMVQGGTAPVTEAYELVCTHNGLSGPVDHREWVSQPALGPGIVYRWIPSSAAAQSPVYLTATLHIYVQTFGTITTPVLRIQNLPPPTG